MTSETCRALVNAQVEINRAVFEMNRPGYPKDDPCHKDEPDLEYIEERIQLAMESLRKASMNPTLF